MKKKLADREKQGDKQNNELELLIPNMVKIEPRTYTPGWFQCASIIVQYSHPF